MILQLRFIDQLHLFRTTTQLLIIRIEKRKQLADECFTGNKNWHAVLFQLHVQHFQRSVVGHFSF